MAETPVSRIAPTDHGLSRVGELPLSEERWALLMPKLRALLADFQELEQLETHELEPVTQLGRWEQDDDGN